MREHTFRGAAVGEAYNPRNPIDPLIEFLYSMMMREGDRNLPPEFALSSGRFRASPRDVARMREALSGTPRVRPEDYDILFNSESREWMIVKWVEMTQAVGDVPGFGFLYETVREPWPVYQIDARRRSPESLSDADWTILRSRAVTLRDIDELDAEEEERQLAPRQAERDAVMDQDGEMLETYQSAFREVAEALGVDQLEPEEAARRFGGRPEDWDPDHYEE